MVRKVFVGILAAAWCAGPSMAQGLEGPGNVPADVPVDVPVAMLLGKPITQADLRADVESTGVEPATIEDWGAVLRGKIIAVLRAQHIDSRSLHAQDSEVASFIANLASFDASMRQSCAQSAAAMRAQLTDPALTDEDRVVLEDQLAQTERAARGERWPDAPTRQQLALDAGATRHRLATATLSEAERARLTRSLVYMDLYGGLTEDQARVAYDNHETATRRAMAIVAIETWKFNANLFQQYGGRVRFNTDPPEPYDAMRMWLEAREAAGDFSIADASLADGFWAYYMDSPEATPLAGQATGAKAFETAWWEDVPPAP